MDPGGAMQRTYEGALANPGAQATNRTSYYCAELQHPKQGGPGPYKVN